MISKDRNYWVYLEDILISMERIEEYISELEFVQFKQNALIFLSNSPLKKILYQKIVNIDIPRTKQV